jgi:hypothetical protein
MKEKCKVLNLKEHKMEGKVEKEEIKEQVVLAEKTLDQLKVMAYDTLFVIENAQNNLRIINQTIAQKKK